MPVPSNRAAEDKDEYYNRICGHFESNETYHLHRAGYSFITYAMRFAWFGTTMKAGVLYEFSYNNPPGISESAVLCVPDYRHGNWTAPPSA